MGCDLSNDIDGAGDSDDHEKKPHKQGRGLDLVGAHGGGNGIGADDFHGLNRYRYPEVDAGQKVKHADAQKQAQGIKAVE